MKLTVLVPCYNEEQNIARIPEILIPELRKLGCDSEILIVDDGSFDQSVATAGALGLRELRVVRHEKNRGIGAAVKTGIAHAAGDLLVILDADYTFHPRHIAELLARHRQGDVDFVIGSPRRAGYGKEIQRYRVFISVVANLIYSMILGRRVTAVSPIFRLYKTADLRVLDIRTDGFDISVEILFRLIRAERTFAEVPTPLGVRRFGASKLRYGREFIRHMNLLRKIVWWRLINSRHWGAVLVAFLLGVIYFSPNILMPAFQDPAGFGAYHPLSLEAPTLDEVGAYGSRLREVMDGHFRDGDAYLREYKNLPTMWGSDVLAFILGAVPRLFRMDDPTPIFVWGDLFFPAAAFLLIYGLFFFLTKSRPWSSLGALLLIAFPNFSAYRSLFSPAWYANASLESVFSVFERAFDPAFSRLFVPGFSFLFFAFFLIAVFRAFSASARRWTTLAAAAFGALFYVYFYYWAFAVVFLGVLLPLLFFLNKRDRLGVWAAIALGGAAISTPYWIKVFSLRASPHYAEISRRVGLEISHAFRTSSLDAYALAAVLIILAWLLLARRGKKPAALILTALLLSTSVVLNIQMLIGFNIQPDHWGSRVNVYVFMLAALLIGYEIFSFARRKIAIGALIFFFGVAALSEVRIAGAFANDFRIPPEVTAGFQWINEHTERDAVFLSPASKTTFYLPFFTHGNVFVPAACYSLASHDEITDRFLAAYAAFGVPEAFLRKSLEANLGDGSSIEYARRGEFDPIYMLYCDYFSSFKKRSYIEGGSLRPFPQEVLDNLMARYARKMREPQTDRLTLPYPAEYVFWGPYEQLIATLPPTRYRNLHLIFSENMVQIYKITD